MAFLNPIFLLGTLAAVLPVLVHLVRRTRARKVEFPSLMFLRRIEQKTVRRRKLRNLLLLALRCAAILLLALAFARPYFPLSSSLAAMGDNPKSVLLIDGSHSMRYPGLFDRAKQAARNILNDAGADEQTALILFSNSYEILMPLKPSRAEALTLLDSASPTLGATDYLQALQAADSILKEAGGSRRRIFLISDFQDTGWNRAAPPYKITPGIELVPVDIGEASAANIAISELRSEPVVYAQKYAGRLAARVSNFGLQPVEGATVDFKLNDLVVERRQLKLGPAGSELVEFSGFNVPEGSNRAVIEVSGDGFTLDNKNYFTVRREDQTKVLAIDSAGRGRPGSFFLQQALLAGENNQYVLEAKTVGTVNPAELLNYRVVIVNDAAGISDQLAAALKGFVQGGGGLVLAAGRNIEADDFNRLFSSLAPAEIGDTVQTRGGYALLSQVKMDHPIFSIFARSGRLTSTRIYAYHRATPSERASVLAALDDGSPVIVEGAAGAGKVLLISTTLDTSWNDLPLTPIFLPLIRQTLEYLGGKRSANSYMIGQVFTAPPDADGSLPAIENPAGGRVEERKSSSGELSVNAGETGFYRLRYRDRSEHVAVNLDPKESDLGRLNIEEFRSAVLPDGTGANRAPLEPDRLTPDEIESKQRVWLPLLMLALSLFIAEAVLARRIRIAKLIG